MQFINGTIAYCGQEINRYLPFYMKWLSQKLQGYDSFGTLSLAGFLAMLFLLIYIFVRNGRTY